MKKRNAACLSVFILLCFYFPASVRGYQDVLPGYVVKLPKDLHYRSDYRIQWWYFTGHLFDDKGREFGYELTFFVVGVQKKKFISRFGMNNIFISHFAVSDVQGEKFFYADDADSGAYGFAGARDDMLKVWVGDDFLEGMPGEMHIRGADGDTWIDLSLKSGKPAVLNGESGYSRKSEESPLNASIYFSYTNLETEGQLHIDDSLFHLKGKSWFDREMSSRGLGNDREGWDWFALQLDDGREIMLYIIRKKDGSTDAYSSGTFIYHDGRYRHLTKQDFSVRVLRNYRSRKTGARYPSQWEVTIPSEDIHLVVTPLLEDQEFMGTHSTWNYYWEGACTVEGTALGRAYVEMTGYESSP